MSLDPVTLAQALVRCPSVTPHDAGALSVLAEAAEALGFTCRRLDFAAPGTAPVANLYARLGTGGRNFCFAGHTDVVPAGEAEHWTSPPFAATIRDGRLIGRGIVDMKGAIACFVAAVDRFLAARREAFTESISLLVTGDEEGVAINGTRRVLEWLAEEGERLDLCIVGEPTNAERIGDMIKIGRRGSLTGRLAVEGKAGHTAYPHLADNPVHRLVSILADLIQQPLDAPTEHFEASTLQVATVDVGNPATNVIPGQAEAVFNIRFNDRWTGASLDKWLRERIGRHGGSWTLDVAVSGEAFLTPPGAVAQLIADAAETVTGRRPMLSTTGGTSDARFIQRACPVAEFGLVGRTMHQVDEAADVADLEALTEIYRRVLDSYFAGGA
ncbi:MAG TPA: succinyl-diaminopimelate desuccinylase [Stellaceae bacterium]|nr:succinyl-diaminopimelate desuccinylase [Stellaceae bacterium]